MINVTRHAAKRFLERVIGTENDDPRSIYMAANILQESVRYIDGCTQLVPIDGFKGALAQIRDGYITTVLIKEKRTK